MFLHSYGCTLLRDEFVADEFFALKWSTGDDLKRKFSGGFSCRPRWKNSITSTRVVTTFRRGRDVGVYLINERRRSIIINVICQQRAMMQ